MSLVVGFEGYRKPSWLKPRWLNASGFLFKRLRHVPLKKAITFAVDVICYRKAVFALLRAPRDSNVRTLITEYPEILFMVSGPYIAKNWDGAKRIALLIDHCRTVEGGVLDLPPGGRLDLCELTVIDPRYRLIVHQPREYIWEGLLDLSLCFENRVVFSLRFSLSSRYDRRIAYIGALQGKHPRNHSAIAQVYKDFSKKFERIRPRDFMIETFQMLCGALEIDQILAVADANKPRRCYQRSYDEQWTVRGGVYEGNGFFRLPVIPRRRTEKEMTPKKRSMYRRRYALLDSVESAITVALRRKKTAQDSRRRDHFQGS
jgi:uncharacterized protein VirK/YbjX